MARSSGGARPCPETSLSRIALPPCVGSRVYTCVEERSETAGRSAAPDNLALAEDSKKNLRLSTRVAAEGRASSQYPHGRVAPRASEGQKLREHASRRPWSPAGPKRITDLQLGPFSLPDNKPGHACLPGKSGAATPPTPVSGDSRPLAQAHRNEELAANQVPLFALSMVTNIKFGF